MVVFNDQGIPLGGAIASASPVEVNLAEETIGGIEVPRKGRARPKTNPERIIGYKAYGSYQLRIRMGFRGIHLITPHRPERENGYKQQGCAMARYSRRWKVEGFCSWRPNPDDSFFAMKDQSLFTRLRSKIACFIITRRQMLSVL
jgi:hypothetical protein